MPEVKVTVESLASTIKHLDKKSLEELTLILSKEGNELAKRKSEIKSGKVKPLSRKEAFDV